MKVVDAPTWNPTLRWTAYVVYNPHDALALICQDGIVVKSTAPHYVGMAEGSARLAAFSVMRYKLGNELGADGYPTELQIRGA